jgi:hypothetical protein
MGEAVDRLILLRLGWELSDEVRISRQGVYASLAQFRLVGQALQVGSNNLGAISRLDP